MSVRMGLKLGLRHEPEAEDGTESPAEAGSESSSGP